MRIAVIGATGATGRKVVERALELGHEVIAVARRPERIASAERLSTRQADVLDATSIGKAIADTDVVISCIGPTKASPAGTFMAKSIPNAIAANFSPGTVMSEGTQNIVEACQRNGVQRLIMQSGVGLSDGRELTIGNRCLLGINRRLLSKAIQDKGIAEYTVQQSSLNWTIIRPTGMSDTAATLDYVAGPAARISMTRTLSFADCADCLVRAATSEPDWDRMIVNVGR
ncbi:NAD(P)H-binding protein [Paenibacillus hunanensis]|uniref:NAD(P)-dependent oxidoreductase n=1 Tax=Paenibacillus hunanensis TaxID=539262 RepID=UPI002A69ACE2|nr:NAD(P)H-binding protein [Paenibacillus hunanensis]WPP41363.1 NAD(P)H-binding protein [Paenibacillus hunanensis]